MTRSISQLLLWFFTFVLQISINQYGPKGPDEQHAEQLVNTFSERTR